MQNLMVAKNKALIFSLIAGITLFGTLFSASLDESLDGKDTYFSAFAKKIGSKYVKYNAKNDELVFYNKPSIAGMVGNGIGAGVFGPLAILALYGFYSTSIGNSLEKGWQLVGSGLVAGICGSIAMIYAMRLLKKISKRLSDKPYLIFDKVGLRGPDSEYLLIWNKVEGVLNYGTTSSSSYTAININHNNNNNNSVDPAVAIIAALVTVAFLCLVSEFVEGDKIRYYQTPCAGTDISYDLRKNDMWMPALYEDVQGLFNHCVSIYGKAEKLVTV